LQPKTLNNLNAHHLVSRQTFKMDYYSQQKLFIQGSMWTNVKIIMLSEWCQTKWVHTKLFHWHITIENVKHLVRTEADSDCFEVRKIGSHEEGKPKRAWKTWGGLVYCLDFNNNLWIYTNTIYHIYLSNFILICLLYVNYTLIQLVCVCKMECS
jgi:hypothetical protein